MNSKDLSKQLSRFEGAYLSGFFIDNPAMITASALLFEKIYLPNQLEMVIEISKKYRISFAEFEKYGMTFTEINGNVQTTANPLSHLNDEQSKTAQAYLILAHQFCMRNHELFPTVFETDLLKNNEVFDVKLVKKGENGALNTYNVKPNPIQVTTEGQMALENRIKNGSVPIIGLDNIDAGLLNSRKIPDKSVAALLAMQSIEMLLPGTKAVEPQIILEARDRLSNHLPQFWSAMLKFSKDGKIIIDQSKNIQEAICECQNIIDTTIRPILIDINEKIIREEKNWFYRILSPVGEKIKFVIGKPSLTNMDLLTASMSLATDIGTDYLQHKRKLNELKDEAGLTYLIKLGKFVK